MSIHTGTQGTQNTQGHGARHMGHTGYAGHGGHAYSRRRPLRTGLIRGGGLRVCAWICARNLVDIWSVSRRSPPTEVHPYPPPANSKTTRQPRGQKERTKTKKSRAHYKRQLTRFSEPGCWSSPASWYRRQAHRQSTFVVVRIRTRMHVSRCSHSNSQLSSLFAFERACMSATQ